MSPPNTPVTAPLDLKSVADLMSAVSALREGKLGLPNDDLFAAQTMKVSLGLFSLVVMGEVKKGKSTFVNALTGIRKLVPEFDDVATSTVFKIHRGRDLRYRVYFQDGSGQDENPKVIRAPETVEDYGTEKGNPGNQKKVDFIAVEAPAPILGQGLVIVDTPGVGGLIKEHKAITFRHAPAPRRHLFRGGQCGVFHQRCRGRVPQGPQENHFKDLLRPNQGGLGDQRGGEAADGEKPRNPRTERPVSNVMTCVTSS
ncbi:MAG: dynamin family protein [Verrucomicrobiales bacterium]